MTRVSRTLTAIILQLTSLTSWSGPTPGSSSPRVETVSGRYLIFLDNISIEEDQYLTEAESKYDSYNISQSREFSWDDKGPGIMLLLAMITEKEKYVDDLQQYCDDVINKKPRSPPPKSP